ncbi:hypothetical protein JCM11251_005351 [Rhodosporidiobolus azoricus]
MTGQASSSSTAAAEAVGTATMSTSSVVPRSSTSLDETVEASSIPDTPTQSPSTAAISSSTELTPGPHTSSPSPSPSAQPSSMPAEDPPPPPPLPSASSLDEEVRVVAQLPLTEIPPVPELLSFNEWRERYDVLPDPSLARRTKKTAQRRRQDAVGAGVAGARAAEYDGDGADLGSLFIKSDENGASEATGQPSDVAEDSAANTQTFNALDRVVQEVATNEEVLRSSTSSPIQPLPNVGSGEMSDPLLHLKDRSNYAAFECAAMVHRSSRKSKGASAILVEKKDRYMLTPCTASPKFVDVELCDEIQIDTLVLANFEFFSSTFKHFKASCSVDYPGKADDWHDLGTFRARNIRGVQVFPVRNSNFCRYLRIDFLSHFGSEHYCPVSLLRVYGFTQLDAYRESERRKAKAIEEALAAAELIDDEQEQQDRLEDALRVEVENLERLEPATGVKNTTKQGDIAPSVHPTPVEETQSADVASGTASSSSMTASSEGPSPATSSSSTTTAEPLSSSSSGISRPISSASSTSATTSEQEQTDASAIHGSAVPSDLPSPTASFPSSSATHTSSLSISQAPVASSANATSKQVVTASSSSEPSRPSSIILEHAPASSPSKTAQSAEKYDSSSLDIPATSSQSDPSPSSPPHPTSSRATSLPSASPVVFNTTSSTPPSSRSSILVETPSPSATRHIPRNESHHYQHSPSPRPPPVIPPPLHQQPQPGESIYGTIMKRLTSLEHNQTLSMHFIEAQSSMLREAFGRVEKRLNDVEASRTRQEQSIRQALLDLESQRHELERERLDLAMQVTLLAEDVRLDRRLIIVQLVALFLLFVFVGFTRGIPTSPFIHLASSQMQRPVLPRKESKRKEEDKKLAGTEAIEKKVEEAELSGSESLRRSHRRTLSTSHRQPGTSKRHNSVSKPGPRRHYGVDTSSSFSKPLSAIRNTRPFTPPIRHSSAPPEEPFPSATALEAKEAARRRIFPQSARKPAPSRSHGYNFPRPSSAGKSSRTSGLAIDTSLDGRLQGGVEASSSALEVSSRDRLMPFPSSHLTLGRSVLNPSTADEADTEPSDSPAPQLHLTGFAADDEGEEDFEHGRVDIASPASSSSNGTGYGMYGHSVGHGDTDERDYHTYSSADEDDLDQRFSTVRSRSPPLHSSVSSSSPAVRANGRSSRLPRPHIRVRPATAQGIAATVNGEEEKGEGMAVPPVRGSDGETSAKASVVTAAVPEPSSTLPSPPPEVELVEVKREED